MKEKFFRFITKNAALVALFVFWGGLVVGERAFPQIEEKTDAYFEKSITQAATVFAAARGINGVISVLQESTVSGAPGGIGMEIAAGQVLDPVDDVIERLSDVLFTSVVSLGIQKIVYEIVGDAALALAAILLAGTFVLNLFFRRKNPCAADTFLKRSILLLLLVRVALPLTALLADFAETYFFSPKIVAAQRQFDIWNTGTPFEFDPKFSENDGFWNKLEKTRQATVKTLAVAKEKLSAFAENSGRLITISLELAGLYIALFIIQVLFLPLAVFWLLTRVASGFFPNRNCPGN